jgi:hypothetical protein
LKEVSAFLFLIIGFSISQANIKGQLGRENKTKTMRLFCGGLILIEIVFVMLSCLVSSCLVVFPQKKLANTIMHAHDTTTFGVGN